jgi:hypothetical protein
MSLNYLAFILLINMADIENIKIFNSEFALGDIPDINDVPDINDISGINDVISSVTNHHLFYYFIGIIIGLSLLGLFYIYKSREKKVTFQDKLDNCYGDVCHR